MEYFDGLVRSPCWPWLCCRAFSCVAESPLVLLSLLLCYWFFSWFADSSLRARPHDCAYEYYLFVYCFDALSSPGQSWTFWPICVPFPYSAITRDNVAGGAMTKYFRALTLRDHISAPPWSLRNSNYFRKENFVIIKIIQKNTLSKVVPIRVWSYFILLFNHYEQFWH